MSVPDPAPPRKPRRLVPTLIVLAVVLGGVGWTAVWLWARGEARARMDAAVADLRKAGYEVAWKDRGLGGFPFRMDVTLTDVRVGAPSGWALEAPRLEAEAFVYSPTHWMLAAPQGLTFVRPVGGPVTVTGKTIRASLSDLAHTPPAFSLEGVQLTFQPAPGAQPFALSAADRVEFHLRSNPQLDEGMVAARVDNGKAQLSGLFARIAGDKPVSMVWTSTLTKISTAQGEDWPSAVRRWAGAGGEVHVRQAGVTAGEALIGSNSGTLTVGSDGRLRGVLNVTLRQAPRALAAMGEAGAIPKANAEAAASVAEARQGTGDVASATIDFQAGQTTLGPVAIGPAPMVYDPGR